MKDIIFSTATELARAIRKKQVSAVEVLEAHLAHIAKHNSALNAIVTLDAEGACQRAQAADHALARNEIWGPLHGVPFTLKDVHSVAGMRTTAGFEPLSGYIPPQDGAIAARLKAAGAIILGKTNVPVLAGDIQTQNPIFGRTNNPWNLDRTPGGSSGGAAAALAAGLVPLEIGSDIGGSIRIPAHFCGVYGLKSTEHRVSVAGHIPDLPGSPRGVRIMGVIGPLARHIDDLELAFSIIAGADGYDTDVPPVSLKQENPPSFQGLRIAWTSAFPGVPVASEIRQAIERLAMELARQGSCVEECLPEVNFAQQRALYFELLNDVMAVFQPLPEGAAPISMANYFMALHQRDSFIQAWEQFFDHWDGLLCPVAMTTAFEHCPTGAPILVDGEPAEYSDVVSYCGPFNLTGHPAVVLPLAKDQNGLPIGVQIVGRRWSEERLLAIAKTISSVTGGFQQPPEY
ncbi:MAG TPA: amidase [Anaerolineales bacterium]|nr:amidase [Anaerolineales bacterium]